METTTELNNDVGEIISDSLYVKIYDEDLRRQMSAELYKIYQHENCSCDIMFITPQYQLTTKDDYSDLMYEGGLYTYERLNGKDCVCIYLNE